MTAARDLLGQRAGVADAGGAAVADEVEAELVEVRRQAGPLVVVGDDLRAGRQRGLDPRLAVRPFSTAFLASSAAPIITDGFEVLVHEVIAAITTAPWSISVSVPSSSVDRRRSARRGRRRAVSRACGRRSRLPPATGTGREAGNDSATPSSTPSLELVAVDVVAQRLAERRPWRRRSGDPVLRALRPGDATARRSTRSSSSVSE